MLKVVEPLPLPLAPPVTVIHAALLAADHVQPVGDVTVDEPVVAPGPTDWLAGEMPYVHGAAACVTVKVWLAIVNEPERGDAFGFAAMLKLADPSPLPLVGPTSVSHAALLVADHVQPAWAVTVAEPVVAAAPADWLDGEIEYTHGAPGCVTVNDCPPIVSTPERDVTFGFAAALKLVDPGPLPLVAPVIVSQPGAPLAAVHAHPFGPPTLVVPEPPPAGTD